MNEVGKIAHRDIKPGNILTFLGPNNSLLWKIADLGSVKINLQKINSLFYINNKFQ